MTLSKTVRSLQAVEITGEAFAPFGQVLWPEEDGKPFDGIDAQLSLEQGTPRFYLMRLHNKGQRFHRITHHRQCTQCLGSLGGLDWLMAVAPAGETPTLKNLQAFKIPGNCFIKLEKGTWHAGPYFSHDSVDFYNLELSDTNVVDHHNFDFQVHLGCEFELLS